MIEISHLTKRYGDFVAVDDVSLVAKRGEVFGFLGPNGAGKTTTIRIIAGLSTPGAGSVRVDEEVIADPRRAKAEVGYVPDRPFLYEKLSGWSCSASSPISTGATGTSAAPAPSGCSATLGSTTGPARASRTTRTE